MEQKKYYWLKLKNNFFLDKRIKKLRQIAGGDTFTIIYLKMQLLSLSNNGTLFFEGIEEKFYEEIALEIDEDVENVKLTIVFLQKSGLLEQVENDEYILTDTIRNIGSESESAERVRRFRERKKEKSLQCNTDVTLIRDREDIREDIREKTTRNIYEVLEQNFGRTISPIEYEKINEWLLLFNEDIISYGIELCVMQNKKTFAYLVGILKNWKSNSYKTLEEIKENQKPKVNPKEIEGLPEWFNKENKKEEVEVDEEYLRTKEEFLKEVKKS